MRYDFRKVITKSSLQEQADEILKKVLNTISEQDKLLIPERQILTFSLEREMWICYEAYKLEIAGCISVWERLIGCDTYEEALRLFQEIGKLLEIDGYTVKNKEKNIFEIEI